MSSSSLAVVVVLRLNRFHSRGMSPKKGILVSADAFVCCIKPPMTTVCPLGVMTTVLAATMSMTGALTPALIGTVYVGSMDESWGDTIICTRPSLVM